MIRKRMLLGIVTATTTLLAVSSACAWGPHDQITRAALSVLPGATRWKTALGEENLAAMSEYCKLPDQRTRDLGDFYADDYLLFPEMTAHPGHVMPRVQEAFAPYYRRALQALRTETPVNACRQVGAFIHFVEDVGAPPHAKGRCPHHGEMENWVRAEQIVIDGYQPQLLGKTDDEAFAGLTQRIAKLVEFSKLRADRALPFVKPSAPDRSKVEPILLESALECARVTADTLHTLFTLSLTPQQETAGLAGTATAGALPDNNHGARIVLLNTKYGTLATTLSPSASGTGWQGSYAFLHMPPGTYQVLAYRTGSELRLSDPIVLEAGKQAKLDLTLPATTPAGNLVQNPDARLSYLVKDVPDRWTLKTEGEDQIWTSAAINVKPDTAYKFGAVLNDCNAKVRICFRQRVKKGTKTPPNLVCPLQFEKAANGELRAAQCVTLTKQPWADAVMEVRTLKSLPETIQKVWVTQ